MKCDYCYEECKQALIKEYYYCINDDCAFLLKVGTNGRRVMKSKEVKQ